MRSIMIAAAIMLVGTFAAVSAQQEADKKAKASPRCSAEACMERGAKMGFSSSTAAQWCAANNNGCK
jgi:hypothetical protein